MRKVTKDSAYALARRQQRSFGNTSTSVSVDGRALMHLHGNTIMQVEPRDRRGMNPECVHATLAGWATPTTRERLNGTLRVLAIPAQFFQSRSRQYVCHAGQTVEIGSRSIVTFDRARDAGDWSMSVDTARVSAAA